MVRRRVKVDDLLLWEQNPRVEYAGNQLGEINNIYNSSNINSQSTSNRQLMNLAKSIAEDGYQNEAEPILTIEKDGKYIVRDGNRRITCIKMLRNPQQYKAILDDADLTRLQDLADRHKSNIPDTLEVLVFQENEEVKLKNIIRRKHDGPQDGAGTLPWPSVAKGRFYGEKDFTGKLEEQFEEQFGQSLTSYIGGSNAVTSTRRVFNSSPAKKYLAIEDIDNLSGEELDKVKALADETKAYIQETDTQLSRLKISEIRESIIDPLSTRNQTKPSWDTISKNKAAKFKGKQTKKFGLLGGRYNFPKNIDYGNPDNEDLNFLLTALADFGQLKGAYSERMEKAYLLAPAIRVFYELALLMISKAELNEINLPNSNVSVELEKNVNYMQEKFKSNKHFITSLSDSRTLFDTYQEASTVITGTDFAHYASRSNLSSHKGAKDYDLDEIIHLFNKGVLFALLSEQYVKYSNRQNDSSR